MRSALALGVILALSACNIRSEDDEPVMRSSICEPLRYEDTPFTHCIAEPGKHDIAMDLSGDDTDKPYRSLEVYADEIGDAAETTSLVMNGGMFDAEGQPIGYYVEDGMRFTVLNENSGPGNFHMLPNGVFFGETAAGPWHVWDTRRFAREVEERPDFATQSGPMLVIDGEMHGRFAPDGSSRKTRNAVGVDDAGRVHFVISEAPVSFGKLARLYRDVLKIDNALFLDGTVSQMWDPATGRMDEGPQIGPLIVVTEKDPVS